MNEKRMIDGNELLIRMGYRKECNAKCPRFNSCNTDYQETTEAEICSRVSNAIDELFEEEKPKETGSTVTLTEEEATELICFIKRHERDDIPDDVWDVCMKMMDTLDIG